MEPVRGWSKRTLGVPAWLVEADRPAPLAGFVYVATELLAGEADMLPTQRGDMAEQFVWRLDAAAAQMPDGAVEIDGC